MAIGQKITLKIKKINSNTAEISLSIHINKNWLVFCLFKNGNLFKADKVNLLSNQKSSSAQKTLKKYINSLSKKDYPSKVKLIHYNNSSALVPSVLFDQKNSLSYLKYNSNFNINDFTANDSILENEINNVYIPYTDFNNLLLNKFKSFDYFHYSSLLIEKFSNKVTSNFSQKVFLNINLGFIDILFFKNKKLEFYNSFDHETNEDILYYLLFCFTQLGLNPEEIHTVCSGNIDLNSKVYALLYKYVRNIELIDVKKIDGVDSNILKSNILFSNY